MKCPNCPQFTSKDTDVEPEGELEIDDVGEVTGDIRIVNQCQECGEELEESTFQVESNDVRDDVLSHQDERHGRKKDKDMQLSVSADISRTDETRTIDRRGKPIRNPRYWRRYYGIHVTYTVTCDTCNEDIGNGEFSDSVQASGMESLI